MEKFRKRYGISSKLQEDILDYICTSPNCDYDILAKHTNRSEKTIGKSIQTLEKNFYVEKQLTKEGKNRSRYIVTPTLKGIYYGLAYLGIQIDEIIRAYGDENEQKLFFEHVQKIRNYTKMKEYFSKTASAYFQYNLFIEGMPVVTDKQNLLSLGFQIGISEALQNKSDSVSYFAEQGTDVMNEILEPRELQDMKNFMDEKKQEITKGFDKEIKELDSQ